MHRDPVERGFTFSNRLPGSIVIFARSTNPSNPYSRLHVTFVASSSRFVQLNVKTSEGLFVDLLHR